MMVIRSSPMAKEYPPKSSQSFFSIHQPQMKKKPTILCARGLKRHLLPE